MPRAAKRGTSVEVHPAGSTPGAYALRLAKNSPTRFCLPVLLLALPTAARAAEPFHFENDILPILARYGCSSSGCHGKAEGQNGFKLSLRGFAAEWDYDWSTKEVNGRRVNYAFPDQSLLVQKKLLRRITSDFVDDLIRGETWAALAYSGDTHQALESNDKLRYFVPREGSFFFVDNLCIPKAAPHPEEAMQFIEYYHLKVLE